MVSDRLLRPELLTTPEQAHEDGLALAGRWHRKDRLRYAVTPRFSLSTSAAMLESCAALLRDVDGALFTSHVNENTAEIETVRGLFAECDSYMDTYGHYRLLGRRSVLAHNVHPTDAELDQLAAAGASVAHCPSSNSALGSGLFPLRRHVEHGVRVALGTDVGAGTSFSLLREGLQSYFMQALLGAGGLPLTAAHMLYLATAAGAAALEMDGEVGDLSVTKQFDAVWVGPDPGGTLDLVLAHAADPDDALAKVFALAGPSDVRGSGWVVIGCAEHGTRPPGAPSEVCQVPWQTVSPRIRRTCMAICAVAALSACGTDKPVESTAPPTSTAPATTTQPVVRRGRHATHPGAADAELVRPRRRRLPHRPPPVRPR